MKALLYSILWIVAGVGLFYSSFFLFVYCNCFDWSPELDWQTILSIAATIGIEAFIVWVAIRTKGYVAGTVSLLVAIALVAVGIGWFFEFQKEALNDGVWCGFFYLFNRDDFSPIWFRITFLSLFLIPLVSWFCYPFRYLLKNHLEHREGV